MIKTLKLLALVMFIIIGHTGYGQTDKEKAFEKGRTAIQLMDNGKVDESIKLFEEAQKLDPDRFDYPYEIAYAHYLKEDYKGAIKILEKLIDHKDVSDRLYQMLGNCYDYIGKPEKAFEVYEAGLKIFPKSGILYLEKGNVLWNKKEYEKALPYYEKGIEIDPKFPSNYYRAARLYCNSSEKVWGLIYGEIFMNIERNSKRTEEISKLLFDTYKSAITIFGDSAKYDFCEITINADDISGKEKLKFPFCMVFGQDFIMSALNTKKIDLNSLDTIRTEFVKNYFNMKHNKTHPNVLFDYQKLISDNGHSEAYNHWILMKGDEDAFTTWYNSNKDKWKAFTDWFSNNGLELNEDKRFYSRQY